MALYRKCTVCGNKVLDDTICECEVEKKKNSYKDYKRRRMTDQGESERQKFYISMIWIKCRESVSLHQFGLDLVEWSKGNIVPAETYHHIVEISEDWDKKLDSNNVIGLTQENHMKVHSMMNRSDKDKKAIQKALMDLIERFENEYYE